MLVFTGKVRHPAQIHLRGFAKYQVFRPPESDLPFGLGWYVLEILLKFQFYHTPIKYYFITLPCQDNNPCRPSQDKKMPAWFKGISASQLRLSPEMTNNINFSNE
jgi:hypothetical protein